MQSSNSPSSSAEPSNIATLPEAAVLCNATLRLSRENMFFNKKWSGKIFAKTQMYEPEEDAQPEEDAEPEEDDELEAELEAMMEDEEPMQDAQPGEETEAMMEDEQPMQDAQPGEGSGSVVSKARLTLMSRQGKSDKNPAAAAEQTKKSKKISAIVFGETPVKFLGLSYVAQVERSTLEDLVAFYRESFGDDGEYVYNFSSAYRAKKKKGMDDNFFITETEEEDDEGQKIKKDLRKDPTALFKTRFPSEIVGSGGVPNIFRIVRFSHIERDAFPQTISEIRRYFPAAVIGMKVSEYNKWIETLKKMFLGHQLGKLGEHYSKATMKHREKKKKFEESRRKPNWKKKEVVEAAKKMSSIKVKMRQATVPFYRQRKVLGSLNKVRFFTNLDKRVMQDHLKFLGTCGDYWKVARDFPTYVMDYMLKRCKRTADCTICSEMLKFHKQNLRDGAVDRMLYPESPFLRKKGKLPFSQNLLFCAKKWQLFARFPKFAHKFPQIASQRALLFKNLIDMRMRRSRTTFEVPDGQRDKFDLMDRSIGPVWPFKHFESLASLKSLDSFLDPSEPFPENADAVQEALLAFLCKIIKNESIVRIGNSEFILVSDFERELRLYLHLRHSSTKLYEDVLPFYCSKVLFPNPNLERILPEGYEYSPDGPVCLAFARRWRVRDLLKRIEALTVEGKELIFHVDTACDNFVFDPRDDLQDWFSVIYRKDTVQIDGKETECGADPLPSIRSVSEGGSIMLSLTGVTGVLKKEVSTEAELKALMDKAVKGECFLLCNNEIKRKRLLEDSKHFRSEANRTVLERSFPSVDMSSYNLMTKGIKFLEGEEATITLPTRMSVFCPRKEVYCIGDMWTPTTRALANHLVKNVKNGAVYELEVKGEKSFYNKYQFWQYNDDAVKQKNRWRKAWTDVPYFASAFRSIHEFVDKCNKNVETLRAEVTKRNINKTRIELLKRRVKSNQAEREAKRPRNVKTCYV